MPPKMSLVPTNQGLDEGWSAFRPGVGPDVGDILRSVAGMSPLPIVLTDPHQPDWPVVFCNRAFGRLTGYSSDETLGRNCRFLQGEETDPASIKILSEGIAAHREVQVDLWNYRKDGTKFWNTMFVGPVFNQEGDLLFFFGSQLDATARLEAEEAKSRSQRLDTLGSMAAGIAHEVNNLMTIIVGSAEGLNAAPLDEKQTERLGRINWAARATGKLTQQMLSFAGRQTMKAGIVDLNAVVGGLDGLLRPVVAAGVDFEIRLGPTALGARVDVIQLELALINLVKNASHASQGSGRIILSTQAKDENGKKFAEVAVIDNGHGMPADISKRATEPFFTTKEHGEGTGLGLSMVSGFCQASGGRLVIETKPDVGTTMRLIFPRLP
jgi:PAS domain S-box-containing protein